MDPVGLQPPLIVATREAEDAIGLDICEQSASQFVDSAFKFSFSGTFLRPVTQSVQALRTVPVRRRNKYAGAASGAVVSCPSCGLPIGDFGYCEDGAREAPLLHSECMAQKLLQDAKKDEEVRQHQDAALKAARRNEYDIGWTVEKVPRNLTLAKQGKLGCQVAAGMEHEMCGLTLAEDARSVHLTPTDRPMAAVNVEYLAVALQVRRLEGREPIFSLDPDERGDGQWQAKRFEPAWLAGTSVGEVMFQADYHLKELSMGEHPQPVVGMKSCFDLSTGGHLNKNWRGREWFTVRKAEVSLEEGNMLVPRVEMGVQAREQIRRKTGDLEDAHITGQDHPMVKYAEAFTRNFDLIAERKSVIFHLRELAKASVLAKSLVEAELGSEEQWCLSPQDACLAPQGRLRIPQLWNERCQPKIFVQDAEIVDASKVTERVMHGVYGGVNFDLDSLGPVTLGPRTYKPFKTPQFYTRGLGSLSAVRGADFSSVKGVDLNLDQFNLSCPTPHDAATAGLWQRLPVGGEAFWERLACKDSGTDLLKAIFNPYLSDRRSEGDLFVRPEDDPAYVQRLQALIAEEEAIREQLKDHFFSTNFVINPAGPPFPPSWSCPFEPAVLPDTLLRGLQPRPDLKAEAMFYLWQSPTPVFDKRTEDGARFRIYQTSSMEIRTVQEPQGQEVVGAVFASQAPLQAATLVNQGCNDLTTTEITKVTLYVEEAEKAPLVSQTQSSTSAKFRFFVVLENDNGDVATAEKFGQEKASWAEKPLGLAARLSRARVFRTVRCKGPGLVFGDVRARSIDLQDREPSGERYAQRVYKLALPAREKAFAVLGETELRAAGHLGFRNAQAWDEGRAAAWHWSWTDLGQAEQQAAHTLGLNEVAWGEVGTRVRERMRAELGAAWRRGWHKLKDTERQIAKGFGIDCADTWDRSRSHPAAAASVQ
jgi:hypothetical protein